MHHHRGRGPCRRACSRRRRRSRGGSPNVVCSVLPSRAGAAVRNPGGIAAEPSGASLVAIAPRSPAGSHFLYLGQLARDSLDFEARPTLRSTRAAATEVYDRPVGTPLEPSSPDNGAASWRPPASISSSQLTRGNLNLDDNVIARSRARSCAASMASRTPAPHSLADGRHSRRCGVKRAVAPFARALGARHPRRAAASGGKSLSSPSSLPPMLTSKLTSHHDHTARACTKRGKYNPPPGPTPGAYLAGRHTLNCRYLWRPEGRIASGRKTLARHFSPVRAGLQKSESTPAPGASHPTGGSHAPGRPISAPGASHLARATHHIRWPSAASARLC